MYKVLCEHKFLLLQDKCPRMQLLDYMAVPCLDLQGLSKGVPELFYHILVLLVTYEWSCFLVSLHPNQHLMLSLLSDMCGMMFYYSFTLHFPDG